MTNSMASRRRWPLAAFVGAGAAARLGAQQPARIKRIGLLAVGSQRPHAPAPIQALVEALRELGYVDGRTIQIEYRFAEGDLQRLPALAVELVRSGVDLIVAAGDAPTRAARSATTTLPIVMTTSGDAVGAGFVASLARPGGNVTGIAAINPELGTKRLQLLRELLPRATRFAIVWNPGDAAHALDLAATQWAAAQLGVSLSAVALRTVAEVDGVFVELKRQRVEAVIVFNDTTTAAARQRILQLASEGQIPAMYEASEWGRCQRPGGVWLDTRRPLPAQCRVHRQNSPRGATGGPARRAADPVAADRESKDRRPPGHRHSVDHSATGRQGDRMKRRQILAGGVVLVGASSALHAQVPRPPGKIGLITPAFISPPRGGLMILQAAWQALGYVEGETVLLRAAEGDMGRVPQLVAELIALKVSVLIVVGGETVMAAIRVTKTTPIIGIDYEIDPVRSGLAASRARPGGNVTGLFVDQPGLAAKRIELLREAVPGIERVALLSDPGKGRDQLRVSQAAARAKGLKVVVIEFGAATNFDDPLRGLGSRRRTGIVVLTSPKFFRTGGTFDPAIQKYRLPTILFERWPRQQDGWQMTYGPSRGHYWARAVAIADQILKGAKPGDLPIKGPDRFEPVINLKTARALGLTIPQSLLLRADEVVQ